MQTVYLGDDPTLIYNCWREIRKRRKPKKYHWANKLSLWEISPEKHHNVANTFQNYPSSKRRKLLLSYTIPERIYWWQLLGVGGKKINCWTFPGCSICELSGLWQYKSLQVKSCNYSQSKALIWPCMKIVLEYIDGEPTISATKSVKWTYILLVWL